jgi:hypothetical protein
MAEKTFWLVGQWREGKPWEVQGIFSTKKKALVACRTDQCFLYPFVLNEEQSLETSPMEGQIYPLAVYPEQSE